MCATWLVHAIFTCNIKYILAVNPVFVVAFTTIADLLGDNTNSESDSDISWIFVKEAGQPGLFHAAHSPLGENDVLVRNN